MTQQSKGFYTTEFWLSLLGTLTTGTVTSGVVTSNNVDPVSDAILKAILAIASAIQVAVYTYGRNKLKSTQATLIAENPQLCTACGKKLEAPPQAAKPDESICNRPSAHLPPQVSSST